MENVDVLKNKITEAIAEYFRDTDYFLVDVQTHSNGKIAVFADGKENITIQKCAEVSRYLENYLESNGLVGEKYLLEVSSPGMDEPFKVSRQYEKWMEKPVEVLLKSGIKEVGILKNFDENQVVIELPEQIKKKEIIPAVEKSFSHSDIKYTRKHFVFK